MELNRDFALARLMGESIANRLMIRNLLTAIVQITKDDRLRDNFAKETLKSVDAADLDDFSAELSGEIRKAAHDTVTELMNDPSR